MSELRASGHCLRQAYRLITIPGSVESPGALEFARLIIMGIVVSPFNLNQISRDLPTGSQWEIAGD